MKNRVLLSLAILISLIADGCEFYGGSTGGSETTNGLTGIIQDGMGQPVANAAVVLLPETFNPIPGKDSRILQRTVTDKSGQYHFRTVASGVYNLEAKDTVHQVQLLVQGIHVDSGDFSQEANGILNRSGSLEIAFSDRHLPENAQAYILGTTFYTFVNSKIKSNGTMDLGGLSAGQYAEMWVTSPDLPKEDPMLLAEKFRIEAGFATKLAPLVGWLHTAKLKFDGTGIGGGTSEFLKDYPLLLRLTTHNFDFTEARSGGEDIRFTRPDGSLIPHQIEEWDPVQKSASIWIRFDSLAQGRVDSSMLMHWGRVDALDISQGSAVFNQGNGFASVWHLGESANTLLGGYRDATEAGLHATALASNVASQVKANIGLGRSFPDTGHSMSASLSDALGGNKSFSVSFWMNFSMASDRSTILSFGQPSVLKGFHFLIRSDTTTQFGPWDVAPDSIDGPSIHQNNFSLAPYIGKWSLVTTVFNAVEGNLKTYVNGEFKTENPLTNLDIVSAGGVNFGKHILLGGRPQSDYAGALDEIRFYDRPLTEAWIRMDYATQKENSGIATKL